MKYSPLIFEFMSILNPQPSELLGRLHKTKTMIQSKDKVWHKDHGNGQVIKVDAYSNTAEIVVGMRRHKVILSDLEKGHKINGQTVAELLQEQSAKIVEFKRQLDEMSNTFRGGAKDGVNEAVKLFDRVFTPESKKIPSRNKNPSCGVCKQPYTKEEIETGHCFNCGEQEM